MKETPVCPSCKSKNVIPIFYGMPVYSVYQQEKEGKIKLGGCVYTGEFSPDWYCKDCRNEF